jgi:uncharacterized repeat protein (TIGR01451 family)
VQKEQFRWAPAASRQWSGCIVGWLLACACLPAGAAGTLAGTLIRNTATLTYSLKGAPAEPAVAVAAPVQVARLISAIVTWQDSTAVPVNSPDAKRALAFLVTNTGNATETFRLARNNAITGDQFDPLTSSGAGIWLESGSQPGLQTSGGAADVVYAPGSNDIALAPDASRLVYVLSDIPAGLSVGGLGNVALTATSTAPGAAGAARGAFLGTFDGVQAVVGPKGGDVSGQGTYLVAGVSLGVAKTVSNVRDPSGGTRLMPGSVLTYRLVLTLTGSGVAEGVNLTDPLPATLSYVAGSVTVDGAARTDAADTDEITVTSNTLQASFGNLPAPGTRVIEFKATVN